MASAMRHIKNKAIDEREAAKKAKEKERAAEQAKQWFTRSSSQMEFAEPVSLYASPHKSAP